MSDAEEKEAEKGIESIYKRAISLKHEGKSNIEIKEALMGDGLDAEAADAVVKNMNEVIQNKSSARSSESESSGGSGAYRFLIWIGILILVNILSAVFDWGFWLY